MAVSSQLQEALALLGSCMCSAPCHPTTLVPGLLWGEGQGAEPWVLLARSPVPADESSGQSVRPGVPTVARPLTSFTALNSLFTLRPKFLISGWMNISQLPGFSEL